MKNLIVLIATLLCINVGMSAQGDQSIGTNDNSIPLGWGTKLYFAGNAFNTDDMWIAKYNVATDFTDLRINIGDDMSNNDRFVVGGRYWVNWADGAWAERFVVTAAGMVGIGVAYPKHHLEVNGTIRAKEVKIEATGWADFVFAKDYQLPSLAEVKAHIEEKKHLPNIPSEAEVKQNGVNVGEMQIKLLQKIEELTLYMIELKEENQEIKAENIAIREELNKLTNK